MDTVRYWPFEVLPPDKQTEHHKQVIAFLDRALLEGFAPYTFGGSNYGACSQNKRVGELIHRGANRYWEVMLTLQNGNLEPFHVDGFINAGDCVLHWLHGEDLSAVRTRFRDHIV